ncbi:MAG: Slp family lipoprotein [Nitrospiraceae bacterium]
MKQKSYAISLLLAVPALLPACTSHSPIPSEYRDKLAPTFDFQAWREASPTNNTGKSDSGTKVELGGRIVQVTNDGKGWLIVAEQLPISSSPVYGPKEAGTRKGDFEFALLYPGELSAEAAKSGDSFVVVGTTSGRKPVIVKGDPKSEPYLVADCIHLWRAGSEQAVETKDGAGVRETVSPQATSCVPKK